MGISIKYKRYDESINKTNLKLLINHEWFKKVFDMKYLELFSLYYNNEQPFEKYSFFDKTIIFSDKTESFYKLIQENEKLEKDIKKVTRVCYFNGINTEEED